MQESAKLSVNAEDTCSANDMVPATETSSSAKGFVPAGEMSAVSAVLWLPDAFYVLASPMIEKEEDRTHASGLQRCLDSLHRQATGSSGNSPSFNLRLRLGMRWRFSKSS